MAKTVTQYPSQVLTGARNNDMSTRLCHITVTDVHPYCPGPRGSILILLPISSVYVLAVDQYIAVKWNRVVKDASFMFALITAIHPVVFRGRELPNQLSLDLEHSESYTISPGVTTNVTKSFHVATREHGRQWCVYDVVPSS